MKIVYIIVLFLPLIFLLFYFASRPTYKKLLLFLGSSIAYFIALDYLNIITPQTRLSLLLLYSMVCFFILSFLFQNNVWRYYSNLLGFTIGWDELNIPIILWESSEEFNFINVLGIPIWKPFSYIKKLRKSYNTLDLTEHEITQQPIPNSLSQKSQIQVTNCRFQKLVRADTKEKYGSCYLLFSGIKGDAQFIAYADRSILRVKPMRGRDDSFKTTYISRMGWGTKLNKENSYDLFGKFNDISVEDKSVPGMYLRAIQKHEKGFSPNLFIHWLSIMLFLVFVIVLWSIPNSSVIFQNRMENNINSRETVNKSAIKKAKKEIPLSIPKRKTKAVVIGSRPSLEEGNASTKSKMSIYPRKDQSEKQQANDRYECHKWAVGQTNYDPTIPSGIPPDQIIKKQLYYKRAMAACLEGRGYTAK